MDPKYPHNVGMVVRLASCYGLRQVWFTGDRVSLSPTRGERLPREERMKGYRDVQVIHHEHVFDRFPAGAVPVAVVYAGVAGDGNRGSGLRDGDGGVAGCRRVVVIAGE